jgi:hypothetical protein
MRSEIAACQLISMFQVEKSRSRKAQTEYHPMNATSSVTRKGPRECDDQGSRLIAWLMAGFLALLVATTAHQRIGMHGRCALSTELQQPIACDQVAEAMLLGQGPSCSAILRLSHSHESASCGASR